MNFDLVFQKNYCFYKVLFLFLFLFHTQFGVAIKNAHFEITAAFGSCPHP